PWRAPGRRRRSSSVSILSRPLSPRHASEGHGEGGGRGAGPDGLAARAEALDGVARRLRVSAAVGAFLVRGALPGPPVKRTHRVLGPLRDLFAALFFLSFGMQIDPATLPPVVGQAALADREALA